MSAGAPAGEEAPPEPAAGDIARVVGELREVRERWREARRRRQDPSGREFPSPQAIESLVEDLRGALFPLRLGPADLRQAAEDDYITRTLAAALPRLQVQLQLELRNAARLAGGSEQAADSEGERIAGAFARSLPAIRSLLDRDVLAAYEGDPAARTVDEVLLCYPGVRAMINHRLAHRLYELGAPLVARIVAEIAHAETGIDIHPGATIGPGFFIDHGTGVVIGETSVIGERVRLYQAVTLGAKRFPANGDGTLKKGLPRHPVVEDDVVIYAGATILGRITIGRGSTIGGNVWITQDVPAGSHVSQATLRSEQANAGSGV